MGDDKHQRRRKQKATEEEKDGCWRLVEIFRDFILQVGLEAGTWVHVSLLC